jgi:hypothetical protein
MKKYFVALTTTALISAAPFALAASSTDLRVKGLITPAACTPTLSSSNIDLGKISSKDLKPTSNTLIDTSDLALTVNCDAAIKFAVNHIDHQAGTWNGPGGFGLGLDKARTELGYFTPKIKTIEENSTSYDAIQSTNNGANWTKATSAEPDTLLSIAASGADIPIAGKDVTFNFEVDTYIARTDSLDLSDDTPINGHMTFDVKYL